MKNRFVIVLMALSIATLSIFAHEGEHNHKKSTHLEAVGKLGDPKAVGRTIEMEMNDSMRFTPDKISVKKGETIRFLVRNAGKIKHEMVLGTAQDLKKHANMMKQMPSMKHIDTNQVIVEPGQMGELVWQFINRGIFEFACLEPGHFEAGMGGRIDVK